ncbi:MAG: hypothetical protein WDN24_19455 [Sphingomonas sp.]
MKSLTGALAAALLFASPAYAAGEETAPPPPAERVGLVPEDSKLLIVFANPVEGKEAEFNAWYDRHMRDFMKLPNFVRVQKFRMLSRKGRPDPAFRYVFLFEFKGDQDESFAAIQAAMKDGRIGMPDGQIVGKVEAMNYGADGVGYRGPSPE